MATKTAKTNKSEYMNQKEAMEYLGITFYSFHSLLQAGLPYYVVGKSKRFSKRAIDYYMDQHLVSETNSKAMAQA